jgi:hypothetical protein
MNDNQKRNLDEQLINWLESISKEISSSDFHIILYYFRQINELIIKDRIHKGSVITPDFLKYLSEIGTEYSVVQKKGE